MNTLAVTKYRKPTFVKPKTAKVAVEEAANSGTVYPTAHEVQGKFLKALKWNVFGGRLQNLQRKPIAIVIVDPVNETDETKPRYSVAITMEWSAITMVSENGIDFTVKTMDKTFPWVVPHRLAKFPSEDLTVTE